MSITFDSRVAFEWARERAGAGIAPLFQLNFTDLNTNVIFLNSNKIQPSSVQNPIQQASNSYPVSNKFSFSINIPSSH